MASPQDISAVRLTDPTALHAVARRLGELCAAEQVILFGSRAAGRAAPDSDVDLALILPDGANARKLLQVAQDALWPRRFPVDLVAIPASVWRHRASRLARQISTQNVVLYERAPA